MHKDIIPCCEFFTQQKMLNSCAR